MFWIRQIALDCILVALCSCVLHNPNVYLYAEMGLTCHINYMLLVI